jgi:hypothetical protein
MKKQEQDKIISAAASLLGKLGGESKSRKKAIASRKNGVLGKKFGKLGGRPKKVRAKETN